MAWHGGTSWVLEAGEPQASPSMDNLMKTYQTLSQMKKIRCNSVEAVGSTLSSSRKKEGKNKRMLYKAIQGFKPKTDNSATLKKPLEKSEMCAATQLKSKYSFWVLTFF